jgi:hypothetical protein
MNTRPVRSPMCDECQALVDAPSSSPPHEDLIEFQSKNLSGSAEPAGMRNFRCNRCDQEWVLYREGWAAQNPIP